MIKQEIKKYVKNAGHSELTEIQSQSLAAFNGFDQVILFSKTGSGKTLAFLLSILSKLNRESNDIQALVLVPSRELCLQIDAVFRSLRSGYKATACYGGHSIKSEENSLSGNPQLIFGTPGRIVDHIHRGNLDLYDCSFLVIDEFDKCLEFGFNEEMEFISDKIQPERYLMLASATRMDVIPSYLNLKNHYTIDALQNDESINIDENIVEYNSNIVRALSQLLKSFKNERAIVFCNYREVTEDLCNSLYDHSVTSVFYHGGMDQADREKALIKFRTGSSSVLVCTDLGARGLDIPDVKHIVHYQYPSSPEAFTHRKGRTARMEAEGSSYLFKGPETRLPDYIEEPNNKINLDDVSNENVKPEWTTIYFSGGKKDKINKIDIVGFLSKKGNLKQGEIGLIFVQDRAAYVGVKSNRVNQLIKLIKHEKIKGKKLKIDIAK